MTVSKALLKLLYRVGHCSSYDDVEIRDTAFAWEVTAQSDEYGVVIPTNIYPGIFVQAAADNENDGINAETLDRKYTYNNNSIVPMRIQWD